jgi:predicted anti-sigma-YlaC factor YlaD
MLTCKEVTELATDYMEGQVSIGTRFWFVLHLARCAACRAYMRQMRLTVSLLRRLGNEPAPAPAELLAMFRAKHPLGAGAADAGRKGPASTLVGWVETLVRGGRAGVAIATVLLASVALLAAVSPVPGGPVPFAAAYMCLVKEVLAGLLPLASVMVLVWRARTPLSPAGYAVAAGLGALVGQASLHLTCPEVGMRTHLLAFHTGGVALAMLLGAAAGRLQSVRRRA